MYNLKKTGRPAYISAAKTGKHSDVVWQVVMTMEVTFGEDGNDLK